MEHIFWEAAFGSSVIGVCGIQYFDLPYLKREDEEIFIDAGCCDGSTTLQFINWAQDSFVKSIAFEPDKRSIPIIEANLKEYLNSGKVELYPTGCYFEKTELCFEENNVRGASKLKTEGNAQVEVESIDNVLKGEKATFIKMDIEGAELDALKGAVHTIQTYRPKLAISIYHKPEDLVEIPLYLMEIMPDYQFYIRHYTTWLEETVLYAI